MGVGRIVSRMVLTVDFSRLVAKSIFLGGAKSDEITFYKLETKGKTLF